MKFSARTPDEAWDQGSAALICHDAGAASHAFAWLASDPSRRAVVYAEGPAARIAASHGLPVADSLEFALAAADWALVGTGWQSDLEPRAMKLCAASSMPCIAIVDHWVNYPERFHGVEIHERPQQVVVTDAAAEELANKQLPWAPVARWPNDQAAAFVGRVRDGRRSNSADQRYLLWLQEPIRDADGRVCDPLSDPLFAGQLWDLIATAAASKATNRVVVRMHPSQRVVPYDNVTLRVEVRDPHESPLADDVRSAAMCLGINSYALYLAAAAGVEAASVAEGLGLPSLIPPGVVPLFG